MKKYIWIMALLAAAFLFNAKNVVAATAVEITDLLVDTNGDTTLDTDVGFVVTISTATRALLIDVVCPDFAKRVRPKVQALAMVAEAQDDLYNNDMAADELADAIEGVVRAKWDACQPQRKIIPKQ